MAREIEGRVTVAVVVKDRATQMRRCLDAIAATDPLPAEVVVVDNGSSDGTWEMLYRRTEDFPVPMRILQDDGTLGRARNTALTAVRTELVAFTDSDCEPQSDWLGAATARMRREVGVVQGRTIPAEPITRRWAATQRIETFTELYEACNIVYRAAELRAAGGFDEEIGFFGEDTAAGWNLTRAGWNGAFCAEAVVRHAVTYPGMGWHLRRGLGYRNWNALVRRYPEIRQKTFCHIFLRKDHAAFVLALVAVAAATRKPSAALLALPYAVIRRPRRSGVAGVVDSLAGVAFDASVLTGMVIGSVRERAVLL